MDGVLSGRSCSTRGSGASSSLGGNWHEFVLNAIGTSDGVDCGSLSTWGSCTITVNRGLGPEGVVLIEVNLGVESARHTAKVRLGGSFTYLIASTETARRAAMAAAVKNWVRILGKL